MLKITKPLTLTILVLLTLSFKASKKETIFIGKVRTDSKNQGNILGLHIEFRIDTLVTASDILQKDGSFKISTVLDKEVDIFYRGLGFGDVYLQTVSPTDKDTIFLSFEIPVKYKKYLGKVICPKCGKHDQTVPIRYGLGNAKAIQHIDEKGDTTYIPYDKKNYYAGDCITSDLAPKYYCKQDKIKF